MRSMLVALTLLFSTCAHSEETTIRILGVYIDSAGLTQARMATQLQGIEDAWNNSGLPAASLTTVEILNSKYSTQLVPLGVGSLTTLEDTLNVAWNMDDVKMLRDVWQADVIILFKARATNDNCGVTRSQWDNGDFAPGANGLDLRRQMTYFIAVVDPRCDIEVAAHELGHLSGGGHRTDIHATNHLYPDSRAYTKTWGETCSPLNNPECQPAFLGTAISVWSDVPIPENLTRVLQYSRPGGVYGDSDHNNVRALATTARSVANYYPHSSTPKILHGPTNLYSVFFGCQWGMTRYDIFWQNSPATNLPVDRYEVWYAQPMTDPYKYGWTVFVPYDDTYVSGLPSRARVRACSGPACSEMSSSYVDAYPMNCGGWGGGGKEPY